RAGEIDMFDSKRAKVFVGSIAVACVAAIPYTPDAVDAWLAAIAAIATALVNFWSRQGEPPDSESGSGERRDHIVFPPSNDGGARFVRLPAALAAMLVLFAAGCQPAREILWPTAVHCAPPAQDVLDDVRAVLTRD